MAESYRRGAESQQETDIASKRGDDDVTYFLSINYLMLSVSV